MKKNHHIELDDASIMEDEITRNGMSPEADGDTFPFDPTVPLTAFPFIEAEGRYSVPRYRKMTDYLNLHFSGIIGNRICEQINRGTAEGAADTCQIVSASYWREDFVTVLAELTVEIDIFYPKERRCRTEAYVTRVLIDLDQELVTFADSFHDWPHRYEHESRDVILSEYLVPIFSTNAIEEDAEQMLRMYNGVELQIVTESQTHLSTNLWTSPMGAPQLLGLGIKSSITGKHAWYVITDDICNKDDRESRAERERTKRQYDELQNIRNRGGRIINLGTPWHKDDVFSKMPNIQKFDCYTTGLLSKEKIEELRQSMAPSLFAANYELKHIASSEVIFETAPKFTDDPMKLRDRISHIDAAYGGRDYTAFTCGKRDWDNDIIYLYGKIWHQAVDKVLDIIGDEARRLICLPVHCEDNGDKGFLAQELFRREIYSQTYTEHMNKYIKITTFLRKWWPRIVFLEGTDPEYIDQILDYTENAEHDDAADSAACVCRILDEGYY